MAWAPRRTYTPLNFKPASSFSPSHPHPPTLTYPIQGGEKYQQTYYIYEELASTPTSTTPTTLVAQAIADMHLNRLPEAEATLQQALEMDPTDAQALANKVVWSCLVGRKRTEVEGLMGRLRGVDEGHVLVRELGEMERRFDEVGGRYAARVAMG